MEEHRPEEERSRGEDEEDETADELQQEEGEEEEGQVTEGDLETFGGEGADEEELGVQCFICGALASHPQLAVCLHSTCRSCAAETGGREGKVTCSRCEVVTPISALLPDYVHDRSAASPPPSAHPSPPRLASLQSLLHRYVLMFFPFNNFFFNRARTRGGGEELNGDQESGGTQVPLTMLGAFVTLSSGGRGVANQN